MKWLLIILITCIVSAFTLMPERITLKHAMEKGLVKVNVTALGGYQGESALVEIDNKSSKPFFIEVEPGRIFVAGDKDFQNLLNVRKQTLFVNANSKSTSKIVGYCCESNDKSPNTHVSFSPGNMKDTSLVRLADYISNNYEYLQTNSIQQSIWAVSNNHATAAITVTNEREQSLKQLVCKLKNEPVPWYIIKQRFYNLPNGRIYMVNDSLSGKLSYNNSKWCYSQLNIYDENDDAILISINDWLKPGQNNIYEVNIPISQLPKGKYKLTLENQEEIFTQKQIEI